MGRNVSKLFTFLENFDLANRIKILDETGEVLFEGEMGDVPQRITNMMGIIRGTVKNRGEYIELSVKKR